MLFNVLTTYQGSILGPIARLLGHILEWIYILMSKFGIENVGVCMIIFTFIVNLLMLPLNIKQQKFAKMSSIMNPEIKAIQEKYKNKKDQESQAKMSQETQAVYKKYGVSPASGCLPMLITLPILFALYRVIYNIPAYVTPVYNMYKDIAVEIKNMDISVEKLAKLTTNSTYVVTNAVKAKSTDINYYIDVLGQFSTDSWNKLSSLVSDKNMTDVVSHIDKVSERASHVNSFLGLNIADVPKIPFMGGAALSLSIIVPLLSLITQFISTKLSMASSQTSDDPDNPMASSMKSMNNIMPFVTAGMCFMFPIGVGIYWVTGNVFRIFQQLLINYHFRNLDIEAELNKAAEKTRKMEEKAGINTGNISKVTKTNTSGIKSNNKNKNNKNNPNYTSKGNTSYEEGSIAAIANMMRNDDD